MKISLLSSSHIGRPWLLKGIPEGDNRTLSQRVHDACPDRGGHAPAPTNARCGGCGLYFAEAG